MDILSDFYKGKRILVTGHTGFKGTWMTKVLKKMGAVVCGYSLPLSRYSFYAKADPGTDRHFEGDISDHAGVMQCIDEFKPEIIFHLASHSSMDGGSKIPDFIFRTNFMGVLNIMEAIRLTQSVKAAVIVTSDKCYANMNNGELYKEDSLLWATDPYSASKVCQELLADCYRSTFFDGSLLREENCVQVATARASNVIAAGDYNISRLVPYLLSCFAEGREAAVRNPESIRPWQYVLDVIWGYLLLGKKLYLKNGFGGAYNFGPQESGFATVGTVAEKLAAYFKGARIIYGAQTRTGAGEKAILKLNSEKAMRTLSWKPMYSLDRMLQETGWFVEEEKRGKETSVLCNDAIDRYILEINIGKTKEVKKDMKECHFQYP